MNKVFGLVLLFSGLMLVSACEVDKDGNVWGASSLGSWINATDQQGRNVPILESPE